MRSALGGVGDHALTVCDEVVQLLGPMDIAVFVESSIPSVSPAPVAQAGSAEGRGGGEEAGRLQLPSAPSDLRAAMGKAALRAQLAQDLDKVVAALKNSSGRFTQWVSLRFKGASPVQVLVLQPIEHAAWQSLRWLENGEMSELELSSQIVGMVAGSVAKARKGQVVMKDRSGSHSANEKCQRGTDMYTKFYADLEQHAKSYEREEGAARPILFCDVAHGPGDSSTAMMQRCMVQHSAAARQDKLVFGLFADPKEMHHHVATARRDQAIKKEYMESRFKVEGFEPVPVPAELRDVRTEVQKPLGITMAVLSNVERDGKHYLVLPEESTLQFKLEGPQKIKFDKLKQDFPPPPPPKRLRAEGGSAGGSGAPSGCFSMQALLQKFTLLKNEAITIAGLEFRILQAENKSTGGVYHFLHNHTDSRRTIPAKAFVTTTGVGKWVDRMLPEGRSAIREGAIAWPWHLAHHTQFCFAFGSAAEVIDPWSAMLAFARRVGGGGTQVYAHNLSSSEPPVPTRRQNVDVALVLNEVAPAQWSTAKLGNHFSKFDLSDAASASLRPCFRVSLAQGGADVNSVMNPSS